MDRKVIIEKQDMTFLSWSRTRRSSGTAGSFLKAQEERAGSKYYYKLSNYDIVNGIVGHETVNEIIVDRLLTILGIPHLEYQLIHADICIESDIIDTYICTSENFRRFGEQKLPLDIYYELEKKTGELPLEFCIRKGWETYIYEMLVVDYLILNRDRHGANIEVLRDRKRKKDRLAPLFDHGLSLLFSCKNDPASVQRFDVLKERSVQCFVGSSSSLENLRLIPDEKLPDLNALKKTDKQILLEDLETVLPKEHLDKIWEMIWRRWEFYEDFCNQRRRK